MYAIHWEMKARKVVQAVSHVLHPVVSSRWSHVRLGSTDTGSVHRVHRAQSNNSRKKKEQELTSKSSAVLCKKPYRGIYGADGHGMLTAFCAGVLTAFCAWTFS